jgi:ketosteroid isomerase-like protein
MKKILIIGAIIFSVVVVSAQDGNTGRSRVKTEIERLNKEMEKAFNANDMAATAAFYSDDAEIVASNYLVKGRKNLDDYWLSLKDKGRGWKLTVIEIGGTGDYVYQLGNSDLNYMVNGKEAKSVTNFVLIWKKQSDNSYKIFRDYLTSIEFVRPSK